MSDLSHKDIKDAILGMGSTPAVEPPRVEDATPEQLSIDSVTIPGTPFEGFESSKPSEAERLAFDAASEQVQARHRERLAEPEVKPSHPNRRRNVAIGVAAGILTASILGGVGAALGGNKKGTDSPADTKPDKTTSAGVTPGTQEQKPAPTVADFEIKGTDPTELPNAVAQSLTAYYSESDDAVSEIQLQALFGDHLNSPESERILPIMRDHRDAIQEMIQGAKKFKEIPSFSVTLDATDSESQLSGNMVSLPVTLTEETNFDDLFRNSNYDYTEAATLIVTRDGDTTHLVTIKSQE